MKRPTLTILLGADEQTALLGFDVLMLGRGFFQTMGCNHAAGTDHNRRGMPRYHVSSELEHRAGVEQPMTNASRCKKCS